MLFRSVPGYYAGYYIAKLSILNTTDLQVRPDMHEGMSVFPNPATNTLHVAGLFGKATLSVYDVTGNKLSEMQTYHTGTVDISSYKSGIYFLQVETEGAVVRKIFVKM